MKEGLPRCLPGFQESVGQRLQSWMEVLLVGLPRECLPGSFAPRHLTTARLGSRLPRRPWDALLWRLSEKSSPSPPQALETAVEDLRQGGLIGLVALDRKPLSKELRALLGSQHCSMEKPLSRDPPLVLFGRRRKPGRLDLVGLKGTLRQLAATPERLWALCREAGNDPAAADSLSGGPSLKELVGQMGDLDRELHLILAGVRLAGPLLKESPGLGHGQRSLPELLDRERHLRCQSLELLERSAPEDFLRPVKAGGQENQTLHHHLRVCCRKEEQILQAIGQSLRRCQSRKV